MWLDLSSLIIPALSRGYTSDFLLALVMRFSQTLTRRQREMKIARVATLELATRRVKKSQEKSRQSWNFRDKIAEIVARVATLQLFARACYATKDYLYNADAISILIG